MRTCWMPLDAVRQAAVSATMSNGPSDGLARIFRDLTKTTGSLSQSEFKNALNALGEPYSAAIDTLMLHFDPDNSGPQTQRRAARGTERLTRALALCVPGVIEYGEFATPFTIGARRWYEGSARTATRCRTWARDPAVHRPAGTTNTTTDDPKVKSVPPCVLPCR